MRDIYVLSYQFSVRLSYEFWLFLWAMLEKKEYCRWLEKLKPIFDHDYTAGWYIQLDYENKNVYFRVISSVSQKETFT